jgi:hypothetical protein
MYFPNHIEDICYEKDHIEQVLCEIRSNFPHYFEKFIETEAGRVLSNENFIKLAEHFGNRSQVVERRRKDYAKSFRNIVKESIESFHKDRQSYLDILDEDALEEYEDDPSYFKNSVLKNQCPIIRATLQNKKATELDKFRKAFALADPNDMLRVVKNLYDFAQRYVKDVYRADQYELIDDVSELGLSDLDREDYTVSGVIGGGIKSHMLYKLFPFAFPNRSREAIWALWYLTSKKTFGCVEDSEFLMINVEEVTTQQNYFYPYDLFAFYALKVYLLLKKEAVKYGVNISSEYRYVILNSFLSFIAQNHAEEIDFLKAKVKDESDGYY